jgi:hypothetical protein
MTNFDQFSSKAIGMCRLPLRKPRRLHGQFLSLAQVGGQNVAPYSESDSLDAFDQSPDSHFRLIRG